MLSPSLLRSTNLTITTLNHPQILETPRSVDRSNSQSNVELLYHHPGDRRYSQETAILLPLPAHMSPQAFIPRPNEEIEAIHRTAAAFFRNFAGIPPNVSNGSASMSWATASSPTESSVPLSS